MTILSPPPNNNINNNKCNNNYSVLCILFKYDIIMQSLLIHINSNNHNNN